MQTLAGHSDSGAGAAAAGGGERRRKGRQPQREAGFSRRSPSGHAEKETLKKYDKDYLVDTDFLDVVSRTMSHGIVLPEKKTRGKSKVVGGRICFGTRARMSGGEREQRSDETSKTNNPNSNCKLTPCIYLTNKGSNQFQGE